MSQENFDDDYVDNFDYAPPIEGSMRYAIQTMSTNCVSLGICNCVDELLMVTLDFGAFSKTWVVKRAQCAPEHVRYLTRMLSCKQRGIATSPVFHWRNMSQRQLCRYVRKVFCEDVTAPRPTNVILPPPVQVTPFEMCPVHPLPSRVLLFTIAMCDLPL